MTNIATDCIICVYRIKHYHNLRVDDHTDPVPELRRVYDLVVGHSRRIEREYGSEGLRLFSRVKY